MSNFHFDEKFWLALAFLTFLTLLVKLAKSAILKSLNEKSQQIAKEILDAKEMKERAVKLLAKAEKYAHESEIYAQKLIKDAEIEALKYSAEAKKSVDTEISKKTAATIERMKMEETIAINKIREKIVTSAISNFSDNFVKNPDAENHQILNDKALQNLEKTFS